MEIKMIDLPLWIEDQIGNIRCPSCNKPLVRENIVAVGVKQHTNGKKKKKTQYLYIEHACKECKKLCGFDVGKCTVEEFVFDMLNNYSPEIMEEFNKDQPEFLGEQDQQFPEGQGQGQGQPIESELQQPKKKKQRKSGISQEEVRGFMNDVNEANNWKDVLTSIGITEEEIEKYTKDSNTDNKNENK